MVRTDGTHPRTQAAACSDGVRVFDLRHTAAPLLSGRAPTHKPADAAFHSAQFAQAAGSVHVRDTHTHTHTPPA
jgi:hypothetical protein